MLKLKKTMNKHTTAIGLVIREFEHATLTKICSEIVELRKENHKLTLHIEDLRELREADKAKIKDLNEYVKDLENQVSGLNDFNNALYKGDFK